MITEEQIEIAALDYKGKKSYRGHSAWAALDFLTGANWALEESKAAELEAENQRLREALELAKAFIEARLKADIKDIGISVKIEK